MSLQFTKPQDVLDRIAGKTIAALDGPVRLGEAHVAGSTSVAVSGITFRVSENADAYIEAFNSSSDKDADGVFGSRGTSNPLELQPQLLSDSSTGWLKYAVAANVKANGAPQFPYLSVAANGDVQVSLSAYRHHPLTGDATTAIIGDVTGIPLAVVGSDLGLLGQGDAVVLSARGKLTAQLEVSWSDLLTTNLGPLLRWLPPSSLIGVGLNPSLSLRASARVTDQFQWVVSRVEQGKLRVAIRKAESRGAGLSTALGVEISLEPWALEPGLHDLLDGLLDSSTVTEVEQYLHSPLEAMPLSVRRALQRVGLDQFSPQELQERWSRLVQDVQGAVQTAFKAKLAAGFAYDWERLQDRTTLLQFVADDALVQKLHETLLLGRLDAVGARLREERITPEIFLEELASSRQRAWGFALSFGRWQARSKDLDSLSAVEHLDRVAGTRKVAYLGVRSYESVLGHEENQWSVDFRCGLDSFAQTPTFAHATLGIHALLRRTERSPSDDDLRRMVDAAIVWRVISDADAEHVLQRIQEEVHGQDVEARIELKIDDAGLRLFAASPEAYGRSAGARALARALPWYRWTCRRIVDLRERDYAPLWQEYLDQRGAWDFRAAAYQAGQHLKHVPYGNERIGGRLGDEVWHLESYVGENRDDAVKFYGMVRLYDRTSPQWESFVAGMTQLQAAIAQGRPLSGVGGIFDELKAFWTQSFHVKAFGALLSKFAIETPSVLPHLERTFTVAFLGGTGRDLVFASSTIPGGLS